MFTNAFLIERYEQLAENLAPIKMDGQTVLIQLFSDQPRQDVEAIASALLVFFPDAHLIGMSSSNVIYQGEIYKNRTLVVITLCQHLRVFSHMMKYGDDLKVLGKDLYKRLPITEQTQVGLCFADGLDLSTRLHFTFFDYLPQDLSIFGGVPCNTPNGRWILHQNQCHEDALVIALFDSETINCQSGCFTQWNPIGKTLMVTEARGHVVYQVDHQPIESIYSRYLGDGSQVPFSLLTNFPFLVGEAREQNIHLPISQMKDGAVCFDYALPEGTGVRFSYDHPSLTLEQVIIQSQDLAQFQPDSIFVYNCISRLNLMEGNQELKPLQAITNTYGCYCMGEFFRGKDGKQRIMHHSMTHVGLREGKPDAGHCIPIEPQSYFFGAMAPLFSLIQHSFVDLDEMNSNLVKTIEEQAHLLTKSYRVDRCTNLPNRAVLRERLAIMRNDEHLMTLKLTNFNQINEKYGYQVGDRLLQDLSRHFMESLVAHLVDDDALYSIGIGEWAAIFSHKISAYSIYLDFSEFVDQLEHVNFEPFGLPNLDYLSVSLSAGLISRQDFPDISVDDLLIKSIDARRYAFLNNKHFCNAKELSQQENERQQQLGWLSRVSRAILNDNVLIVSQPIVAASSHDVVSCECLVRIADDGEVILPGRFLPIIEGTHLYTRLSRQVISKTFDMMDQRTESFSINLAPQDFMSEKTLAHLEEKIKSIDDPSRVGLEVLENEQIKDYGHMIDVCNTFRKLGAKIIVDDFGSGYSNIDEIIKLEPQIIKLDGSIIRNIDQDIKQRKIAQQLIQLCHILNTKTVAEFVHNELVCQIAEDMGIDYLQGFYLGKPTRLR